MMVLHDRGGGPVGSGDALGSLVGPAVCCGGTRGSDDSGSAAAQPVNAMAATAAPARARRNFMILQEGGAASGPGGRAGNVVTAEDTAGPRHPCRPDQR